MAKSFPMTIPKEEEKRNEMKQKNYHSFALVVSVCVLSWTNTHLYTQLTFSLLVNRSYSFRLHLLNAVNGYTKFPCIITIEMKVGEKKRESEWNTNK